MTTLLRSTSASLKHVVKQLAVTLVRAVLRRPRLKLLARKMLVRLPALQGRLQAVMYRAALAPHGAAPRPLQADDDLSPRTLSMLGELQQALAQAAERPAERLAERSNERPTERPTELPTERPTELPTDLHIDLHIDLPIERLIERPTGHATTSARR